MGGHKAHGPQSPHTAPMHMPPPHGVPEGYKELFYSILYSKENKQKRKRNPNVYRRPASPHRSGQSGQPGSQASQEAWLARHHFTDIFIAKYVSIHLPDIPFKIVLYFPLCGTIILISI